MRGCTAHWHRSKREIRYPQAVFRAILCPVDFSTDSTTALRYARAVAHRTGGRLTALYVNDPWLANAAVAVYGPDAALEERSRDELARFTARAIGANHDDVTCRVARGDPAKTILATRADLVVIGTHGLGGVSKLFFGSTTARVLERTSVPVLAVPATHGRRSRLRPKKGWPGGRVVAPLALDRTSRASAARAAAVARAFGMALTLVHAVPPLQIPPFMATGILDLERQAIARATHALARVAATVRGVRVRSMVAEGDPADVVAVLSSRPGHGLVVVTLDPRGGLFHSRPGTISYRVLRRGAAPVLALPPGWHA